MSDQPTPTPPASPPPAPPPPPHGTPPPPSRGAGGRTSSASTRLPARRGGALAALALILALIALAGVAFGAWQWWQWRNHRQAGAASLAQLTQRVTALASQATTAQRDRSDDAKMLSSLRENNDALDQRLDGMGTRVTSLENAVAGMARHGRHGRRAMLLDQTELLLRLGEARYRLFHDVAGTLKAYALAEESLSAVEDPALAGVRRALATERKALSAMHPAARSDDLAALAQLRDAITQLPLKPVNTPTETPAPQGFWQRAWHALSTAVVVRRTDGAPQTLADARLTRRLAALDVAEAEAARLAWNGEAFHAALQRVDHALATAFDTNDAGVAKARGQVERMLAEPHRATAPASLGAALKALQNVRAVQGLQDAAPVAPASAPAASASAPRSPA